MMKSVLSVCMAMGCVLAVTIAAQAYQDIQELGTVGVYDEDLNATNQVDAEHPLNAKTLAQFKIDVAAAYAADLGGVCDFETCIDVDGQPGVHASTNGYGANWINAIATDPTYYTGPYQIRYGASANKVLNYDVSATLSLYNTYDNLGEGISGYSIGEDGNPMVGRRGRFCLATWLRDGTYDADMNFEDPVVELGLTLLSQDTAFNGTVTAYFSGGGSDAKVDAIAAGQAVDDTFFYFAAPSGETITRIVWNGDAGDERHAIDDLAFIVESDGGPSNVPEPAALGLIALGVLGVLLRKRS